MRVKSPRTLSNLDGLEELKQYTSQTVGQLFDLTNGRITFSENIQCKQVSVSFVTPNADTVVAHGLGYAPNGYITVDLSAAMIVYNGSFRDSTNIALKSSATGTAKLIMF